MSIPRFIYTSTDGLTSTTQIALKPIPNMNDLWDTLLIPFYRKKNDNTEEAKETHFMHEEIMDYHECKFVRKVRFVYDDTIESKNMFLQLFQFENPEMSILVSLSPLKIQRPEEESSAGAGAAAVTSTNEKKKKAPCLIDIATDEIISVLQLYYDEPSQVLQPLTNFKYVYIVQAESRPAEQYFLQPMTGDGVDVLLQLWGRMKSLYQGAQEDSSIVMREKHELVDHVNCGKVMRFFLHYDITEQSLELLYNILNTRRGSTTNTLRITLVPRTPETESVLRQVLSTPVVQYPCLINAATRQKQEVLPFESHVDKFVSRVSAYPPEAIRAMLEGLAGASV